MIADISFTSFFIKIKANVNVEASKEIVGGELFFTVIV